MAINQRFPSKKIEAEFGTAVVGLYPPDSKVPELGTTLSRDGHSFVLSATNKNDLDKIAPTFAQILKQNGVKSASLVLIGSEIVLEGKTYNREEPAFILGGFRIHDDARVENLEANAIIDDSIEVTFRIPESE